ncbi:MAG: hypothetical protein D6778_02625 [Nitrospirae bacterium]|nr:MAG: hypothetical protein D6778_02625 [Nitrospirota bacterium]
MRFEYITRGFYFVFKPVSGGFAYCSGVNVDRFLPITKGRHKAMNNPAIRGLQNLNLELRAMAIEAGVKPKTGALPECSFPRPTGDIWYTESVLFEGLPEEMVEKLLSYAVVQLLKKIDKAIMLQAPMPDDVLEPEEMERFIDRLCERYGG